MTKGEKNRLFGLLGKNISYSFSKGYFIQKFNQLKLMDHSYVNFDIQTIKSFKELLRKNTDILGLNVTIPYKQEVIPFLDHLDNTAEKIGAVNTIKFEDNGKLKGYNTDVIGFEKSIKPLLKQQHTKALILGTGGASKAIAFALQKNNIEYHFVSRNPKNQQTISYQDVTKEIIEECTILINCTPLGTFPDIEKCPNIPYEYVSEKHLLYDLIYNPEVTTFLNRGKKQGAAIKNGLEMLQIQAEESWKIWNN